MNNPQVITKTVEKLMSELFDFNETLFCEIMKHTNYITDEYEIRIFNTNLYSKF
jgi:hypothetical protein